MKGTIHGKNKLAKWQENNRQKIYERNRNKQNNRNKKNLPKRFFQSYWNLAKVILFTWASLFYAYFRIFAYHARKTCLSLINLNC